MKLNEFIDEDKPREKMSRFGVEYLSDSELLSILLRTGTKKESVNELSSRILKEYKSLKNLSEASLNNLCSIDGIKESKATIILAAFEIGKRAFKNDNKKLKLRNTFDIFNHYKDEFINVKQEKFYVLF